MAKTRFALALAAALVVAVAASLTPAAARHYPDGVVVVPQDVEEEVIRAAWAKVHAENEVRDAIRGGMGAVEAFRRYGVL